MADAGGARARVVRARARAAAARGPPGAARRASIMAAIYRTLLDEIERDGFRVLDQRIALTPLRKLWIAWKTARAATSAAPGQPGRERGRGPAHRRRRRRLGGLRRRRDAARGAGVPVTLFEQATTLGGRARRVERRRHRARQRPAPAPRRLPADARAHRDGARRRPARRAVPPPAADARALRHVAAAARSRCARGALPAPLHLAAGSPRARGLSWRERAGAGRAASAASRAAGFAARRTQTVAECLAATPRRALAGCGRRCASRRSTRPPARASAQAFATVLREAFAGRRGAPATSSSRRATCRRCFPMPPRSSSRARGGEVRTGVDRARVRADAGGVSRCEPPPERERFAAAIVAVGPHQLAATVAGARSPGAPAPATRGARRWSRSRRSRTNRSRPPISRYPGRRCALPAPIARLDDAPGQWVFDRSAALGGGARRRRARAARRRHQRRRAARHAGPRRRWRRRIDAQLRRLQPGLPRAAWSRVIAERRATYACTPATARARRAGRVGPGLYLAGDYTDAPTAAHARSRDAQRRGRRAGAARRSRRAVALCP